MRWWPLEWDLRSPSLHNVRFDKLPEERKAVVVALRAIAPGEELFVDYGRWYWLKSPGTVLKALPTTAASTSTA